VVGAARERYAHVVAVLVTAPRDMLAARLAVRDRATDGSLEQRVGRAESASNGLRPDVVINNVGDPDIGARRLLDTVYASGVFVV
jgi:ribose 1,5-bisphosphokinase